MKRLVTAAAVLALVGAPGAMPAEGRGSMARVWAVADDPFIGTFEGDDDGKAIRVVITADDKDYEGTISAEGKVYTFYGVKMKDTFFVGTARPADAKDGDDSEEIEFEARIEGDTLTLDHEGDKVTLKRAGKGGLFVKKEPAKVGAPGAPEPMVGEFVATIEGRTVRMKLAKEGDGYTGTATGPDGDPYNVTIVRKADDLTITLKKADGSDKVESATGMVTADGFVVNAEGKAIAFARVGAQAHDAAPVAAGGLAGTFDARFDNDDAVLALREGPRPGFFIGTMQHDGRTYDVGVTLEGDKVTGTITRQGGERGEPFNGTFRNGVLRIEEGNESVTFRQRGAAPEAPVAAGEVTGEYTATVDNEPARLVLKAGDAPGAFVGTLDADNQVYDVVCTITGGEVRGTIQRQGRERTESFNGVRVDGTLRIKGGGQVVVFRKVGAPGAGGPVTLPSGIAMTLPTGWTIKVDETFCLIDVPNTDLLIVVNDEKLGERTHEQFTKEWTEFLDVFFLKPTEEPRTSEMDGEQRTKINMAGERKDGTKIIGYNGVRSKGGLAIGAVIAGEEKDVESVLKDAEGMMKSMRWPGDAPLDIKVERRDEAPPKQTAPAPAPAPAGAAPLQPNFVRVVLPVGLEFTHPEDWDIERNKDMVALTPPSSGDPEEMYIIDVNEAEAGADVMGPAMQRELTEAALELDENAKMVGQPRSLQVAGQRAAVYTFDSGDDERLVVYTMVSGDRVFTLSGMGKRDALARSARMADKVFQSFKPRAPGKGAEPSGVIESALVGVWTATEVAKANGAEVRTELTIWLNGDGTFKIAATVRAPDGPSGSSTTTVDPVTGTWSARNAHLFFETSTGDKESMGYKHVAGGMVEVTDGGRVTLWTPMK